MAEELPDHKPGRIRKPLPAWLRQTGLEDGKPITNNDGRGGWLELILELSRCLSLTADPPNDIERSRLLSCSDCILSLEALNHENAPGWSSAWRVVFVNLTVLFSR